MHASRLKRATLGLSVVLGLGLLAGAASGAAVPTFKSVKLSDFMMSPGLNTHNGLSKINVFIPVPAAYQHVDDPDEEGKSYALSSWMRPEDAGKFTVTREYPENGIVSAKLSVNVGYDQKNRQFTTEADLPAMRRQYPDLQVKRYRAGDTPVLLINFTSPLDKRPIYIMYIAVQQYAIKVDLVPPGHDRTIGNLAWKKLAASLTPDTAVKKGNQSP